MEMKKKFEVAEVQVIKFECHDILTGPSSDQNYEWNDTIKAYIKKDGFLWTYQIYNTSCSLGDREKNVTTPYGLYSADDFKPGGKYRQYIEACV